MKETTELNKNGILKKIKSDIDLKIFESVDSTNNIAKITKLKKDTVIVAKEQFGGKGRMGRSFVSPKNSGIYFTVVPVKIKEFFPSFMPAVSLLVSKAIEKVLKITTQIKWVNDVYYNGKKICGILCEAVTDSTGNIDRVVIGIGINIFSSGEIDGLGDKAGSLYPYNYNLLSESKKADAKNLSEALIAEIVNSVLSFDFKSDFIDEYKARCFLLGREITVMHEFPFDAIAVDIDKDCRLIVKNIESGELITLMCGEVSIKLT